MADSATATRGDRAYANGHRRQPAGRRRGVPGGRAVLGGFLVAASMVGLFYASSRSEGGPERSYIVARRAVPPGAKLQPADLARLPVDLPPATAGRAFTDADALVGATVIAPLAEGELIQSSAVVAKPSDPSSREVTFAVAGSMLARGLEAGERIDVLATYGNGEDAFTTVVLRSALVVGLDRGDRPRVGDGREAAVTVAVDDPADAVAAAHAVQLAKLTVVRATGAAPYAGTASTFRQVPAAAAQGRS
ncbi:MAG: SAF domain-containing protein [Acidimicrobiia bacterium]